MTDLEGVLETLSTAAAQLRDGRLTTGDVTASGQVDTTQQTLHEVEARVAQLSDRLAKRSPRSD